MNSSTDTNSTLLKANNQHRIRSRDMLMLAALWMELYPSTDLKTVYSTRRTGCVLVDQRDRIISLTCTGESHAIVRAILKSPIDPHGCDIYVSRFPCSLCTKMMVQAGIRKIYYFPAKGLEIDWVKYCEHREKDGSPVRGPNALAEKIKEAEENNINSVSRLIANNPIAMSKYIPTWKNTSLLTEELSQSAAGSANTATAPSSLPTSSTTTTTQSASGVDGRPSIVLGGRQSNVVSSAQSAALANEYWQLDDTMSSSSTPFTKYSAYQPLAHKFEDVMNAINILKQKYLHRPTCILSRPTPPHTSSSQLHQDPAESSVDSKKELTDSLSSHLVLLWQHAIVLAHIASKRTDDPKIGVGAVLVYADGSYGSVGWNGYPKKADILDYPQAGADDFIEHELKYDYILHAEQNALLWRMNPTISLQGSTVVSTKMPCDECSPVLHDCGVIRVVANVQIPKSPDDPARLRGLTYEKIGRLMKEIWVF